MVMLSGSAGVWSVPDSFSTDLRLDFKQLYLQFDFKQLSSNRPEVQRSAEKPHKRKTGPVSSAGSTDETSKVHRDQCGGDLLIAKMFVFESC